ncbi:hypothetical protein PACTADRAFT_48943 [Pachysolen tannophilus NRRL Y-2460]|uniref:RING-type domain-containing protein n=1 Tax=Pachysolen tannophilus NRRL Y-2460 TaxID=669874 RepID=A0A1E4TZJ2_PACTA|nr:hypothetical protein PACTADRAFT_48943 [Pachysolen tannophilus NRRL Y-2460]
MADTTTTSTSSSVTPTATSTSSSSNSSDFIGNTPSTVLFFIALAVGVCIALLFVFFTLRYFFKTKFGLYIPQSNSFDTYRTSNSSIGGAAAIARGRFAFVGLQYGPNSEYSAYAFRRDYDTLLSARARRRLQRRRYKKKRKLTKDEVETLFPVKTYSDWLNGGREEDHARREDGIIVYGNDIPAAVIDDDEEEEVAGAGAVTTAGTSVGTAAVTQAGMPVITAVSNNNGNEAAEETGEIELNDLDITELPSSSNSSHLKKVTGAVTADEDEDEDFTASNEKADPKIEEVDLAEDQKKDNSAHEHDHGHGHEHVHDSNELHFSSGICAICLEVLEPEDLVRGLICGHVFHQECLDPWLITRKACCPMCKRDYYMKDNQNANSQEDDVSLNNANNNDNESYTEEFETIYPRPTVARAAELLLVADTYNNNTQSNNNNSQNSNGTNNATTNTTITTDATTNVTVSSNGNDMDNGINPIDVINIREEAEAKLPTYYNWKSKFFWRLMGFGKDDIKSYLIVRIYEARRADRERRELIERNRTEHANNPNSAVTEIGHNSDAASERRSYMETIV